MLLLIGLVFMSYFVAIIPVSIATNISFGYYCIEKYDMTPLWGHIIGFIAMSIMLVVAFSINPLVWVFSVAITFIFVDESSKVHGVCFIIWVILFCLYSSLT